METPASRSPAPERLQRHWRKPFRMEGDPNSETHEVPARVVEVTERAWTALQDGGPDQVVPGFGGLGVALVLRNLPASIGDSPHPPFVVYATDKDATKAYHSLKVPPLGRWASSYPMFYRDPDRGKVPLNKRGLPRNQPGPRPVVHRAFSEEDLERWREELDNPNFLFVVRSPDEIPALRPTNAHAIVQGLDPHANPVTSLKTPCDLVLPRGDPPEVKVRTSGGRVARFQVRERNTANAEVLLGTIPSEESDLARLTELYIELSRQESWSERGSFLGRCKTLLARFQADVTPAADLNVDLPGPSTKALIGMLRNSLSVGRAPESPQIREFIGRAVRVLEQRHQVAPPKASWLEARLKSYESGEGPDLVVDASHNRAKAQAYLKNRFGHAGTQVQIETVKENKQPADRPVLVTTAPGPRLLHELITGRAPLIGFLLYPWEVPRYANARRQLLSSASQMEIDSWPDLPPSPDVEDGFEEDQAPLLVPRERTDPGELGDPSPGGVHEELPPPSEAEDEPSVELQTPVGSHAFPPERRVLVRREGAFHEMEASDVQRGDVLALPSDGAEPSAHEVVLRICSQNQTMEETRAVANMWRQELRNLFAESYADSTIKQMHEDLDPGVQYPQFRRWLKENDPVKPERPNLRRLMVALGYDEATADMIYAKGLDHLADRREIQDNLLSLSKGHLHELYDGDPSDADVDSEQSVSFEDLQAMVKFEKITEVRKDVEN